MKISGRDCVSVVTKAADERDNWSLIQYVLFLCSRWTQRKWGENGNAFDLLMPYKLMVLYKSSTVLSKESANINLVWVILTMWYPINHQCRKCSLTDWVSGDPAGCRTSLWAILSLLQLSWWPPLAPVQHSKAEGAKAMHVLETSNPPYCRNQIRGYRHWYKQWCYFLQKGHDCCKRLLLPPLDWWEREGFYLTHSGRVGGRLFT